MGLRDLVTKGRAGIRPATATPGGSFGHAAWGYPGFLSGGRDWNREAGVRWDNSVVYAAIMGAWNWLSEVDFYVARPKGDMWEEVPGHPISELLQNPNPWYDGLTMLGAWIVAELAGPGYSATLKHRSTGGKVVALEVLPHYAVIPFTAPGSGNFIDFWQVSLAGGYLKVDPRNILQQRFGFANPARPQTCVGPLLAALLEVVTDKEAANFAASLLKNVGITPHLISPDTKFKDENGEEITFTDEQANQIKAKFEEATTGDNRGRPLVSPLPIKVDSLSFSPSDMNLEAIRNISEERICAVLGIHPLSLYLGTALQQSNNRASSDSAFKQTARSFVKPYGMKKANQLTRDLIPELGEPGERVFFRHEAIEALQEDKSETAKRDETEVRTYKTINEKRAEKGLPPHPDGDRFSTSRTQPNDSSQDDEPEKGSSARR